MADDVTDEAVTSSHGNGAQMLPSLGHFLPSSPPPAVAAETGLAAASPGIAYHITSDMDSQESGVVNTTGSVLPPAVPPSLPPSIGLGLTGAPANLAGAGLLSQIHATSWDPTLSTDWDNEKASQQCILRIKR